MMRRTLGKRNEMSDTANTMTSADALNVNSDTAQPEITPVPVKREPRKLSAPAHVNKTEQPKTPALPTPAQIAKMTAAQQVEAFKQLEKAARAARNAATEAAKKERGPRGDGGGTAKLQLYVLQHPGLRGDKLEAAVNKAGIKNRSGEKLNRATIDLGPQDMAHRIRTILDPKSGMTSFADLRKWLAAHDASVRAGK